MKKRAFPREQMSQATKLLLIQMRTSMDGGVWDDKAISDRNQ